MDIKGFAKKNRHMIKKTVVGIFCLLISVCVLFVMLNLYNPNQNNLGAFCTVCMDIICIIILIILLSSVVFGNIGINWTTRLYSVLIVAAIWAMFLDFLNWAFDGSLTRGGLTYWFTVGSLCMGSILAGIFSLYIYAYMYENHNFKKMRKTAGICAGLNLFSFCLTLVLALTGTAFTFKDGHYEAGVLYDVVTVIPVVSLLYIVGYLIFHVKTLGLHDVLAAAGYIVFMIVGALIESSYSIGSTYVSVAIADIFIFILLQNEIINEEKRNVQKWKIKSNTDELTGFLNRYAYVAALEAIEGKELDSDFVYVSVDVNSLKNANDTKGHAAGDELLLGACECMEKCFGPYGQLYRVGGDEFIALMHVNEGHLADIQKEINEVVKSWQGEIVDSLSISCGYVTGSEAKGMTIREVAILADQRMYRAKDEYYLSNNIERRKG